MSWTTKRSLKISNNIQVIFINVLTSWNTEKSFKYKYPNYYFINVKTVLKDIQISRYPQECRNFFHTKRSLNVIIRQLKAKHIFG